MPGGKGYHSRSLYDALQVQLLADNMLVSDATHVHASAHIVSGLIIILLEAVPTPICHCLQPLLPHPAVPLHSRHAQRLLHAPHKHVLLNTIRLRSGLRQPVDDTHGTLAKPAS